MLLCHPEPCGVCPLGGTRSRPVVARGGARAQATGCYGETVTSGIKHPNRLRRNTHLDVSFASYDPCSGQ
jgi:hypothetical protein